MPTTDKTPPDTANTAPDDPTEIELSDADILEAMREIPGYLDITADDFRAIYHLAYRHARERLLKTSSAMQRDDSK